MKRIKSSSSLTNLVNNVDLPIQQKQNFAEYIELKKKKEQIQNTKNFNKVITNYQDNQNAFDISNTGISGLDPENVKIVNRIQKDIVCIDSKYRNTSVFPNSNYFKTFLGKNFKNVVKVRVVSTQIPNVEEVIRNTPVEIQNNIIAWQNEEDFEAGIKENCPFVYLPNEKKLQVTITGHGLTVNSNVLVKFSNSSIPLTINLIGERSVFVLNVNTIELDYDALSNFIGTITVDIGQPIYKIDLTPGSYDSLKIASEIETKINLVKRSNGEYHYMKVDVNNRTDIFTFSNYNIQKLLPSSISTVLNSNFITVNQVNHSFKNGDTIYIENITRLGGIPSESLNGLFTVTNATLNSFQFETNSTSSQTSTGGGNSVIIGKQMSFRFLFDSENTLIQYNIGFPNEDSTEYIGVDNPISTNVLNIVSFESNIPTNFTTITTTTPHNLNGNTFIEISDITTNSNPIYITTAVNHNISDTIQVKLKGLTTTPDINETIVTIIPLTNTKLAIDSDTLILTSNTTDYSNAYMYYGSDTINIYNLIAHSNNVSYENHLNIPVYSITSNTTFTIENTYNYVDNNSVSIATIGTNKLIINHSNHSFNNITELYSNGDLPIYSGVSSNYDSINLKTLTEHTYSNRYKTDSILLENGNETLASSSRTITAITIPETGTVKFALNSVYYYTIGESITVAGTTTLNGVHTITNVDYSVVGPAPFENYTVSAVYVSTDITTLTFTTPTLVPNFHQENTVRIIFPQHQLDTNDIIRILDTSIAGPELKDYLIEKISDNSFLIEYTHTTSVSDTTISILQKTETIDINDSNYTTPQLIGTNDFFNEYDIKNTVGEIELGDSSYISNISIPDASWNDTCTNETGQYVYITGKILSKFRYIWPAFSRAYSTNNMLLFSNDYGNTFNNIDPTIIYNKNTGDAIQILDNNGNNSINENFDYTITKLNISENSFLINVNHIALIPDTLNIIMKNSNNINNNVSMYQCAVIDNDSNFNNSLRNITNISFIYNSPTIGYIYMITVNSAYYYIEGEEIVLSGTNIDGTWPIIGEPTSNTFNSNTFFIYNNINQPSPTFLGATCYLNTHAINTVKVIIPLNYNGNSGLGKFMGNIMGNCNISYNGEYCFIDFTEQLSSPVSKFLKISNYGTKLNDYIIDPDLNINGTTNKLGLKININSTGQYVSYTYSDGGIGALVIYSSIDFGETFYLNKSFTDYNSGGYNHLLSSTGQYQYIIYQIPFNLRAIVQISNDFGINWKIVELGNDYTLPNDMNNYIDISENGQYITFTAKENFGPNFDQKIFRSDNYGESFTIISSSLPTEFENTARLYNVSMDATGRYQIVSGIRYNIYSDDYGISWNYSGSYWGIGGILPNYIEIGALSLSKNGKYFYALQSYDYPIGNSSQITNILYKWDASFQEITFQVQPSQHYYQNGDTVEIENHPDSFMNGVYTIFNKTSDSFDITPNFLIVPTVNSFQGTVKNKTRINVITDSQTSFTSLGNDGILIENESNSTFNINSITRTTDTLIKIKLDSIGYYLNTNESIIISGTNNLDGTYAISNVVYNPNSLNLITEFYINSTEPDLTFTSPTVLPDFYTIDTLRILLQNHNLNQDDTIYLSNSGGSGVPIGYYTVSTVLSPHSFLINYIHSPIVTTSNIIIQYSNFPLGILQRNQNVAIYRAEGIPQTNLINTIGGINVDNINNRYYQIEKIIDANNYIINSSDKASYQETGGGSSVYISSVIHGLRKQQLNTYDGTDLTKLFRSISLEGYNYVFLVSSGIETKLDVVYNNSRINNVFAKILLNQPPGHMCFDSFISTEKIFNTPIPELSELLFAMYTPDGYLYNFNDTNYSLDLEVTTIIEEIEDSNISSKNNKKLVLYQ